MHQDQSSSLSLRRREGRSEGRKPPSRQASGSSSRRRGSESRRAAFARPRVLLAAAAAAVAGSSVWVGAQGTKSPARVPSTTSSSSLGGKALKLEDISTLVREASTKSTSRDSAAAPKSGDKAQRTISTRRFGLTEVDLTPGTISDDRQPAYGPTGTFIAFASNRTNAAGTAVGPNYHIWVMNRDGSGVRQITGRTTVGANRDDNVDQWQPTFSPDGNSIAYKSLGLSQSSGTTPINTRNAGNLFTVSFLADAAPVAPFVQITQFQQGDIDRPTYGANGLSIAFGHSGNVDNATGDTSGNYDIFSISPTGGLGSLRRLTGGAADPAGATSQNRHPAFSLVNPTVLYFTSTRSGASRIFLMSQDGSGKRQISNPTDSAATDEYPAPSITAPGSYGTFTERVAFQSNRLAAADDTVRDTNIYSINISTAGLGPAPTPTPQPTPKLVVSGFSAGLLHEFNAAIGGFEVQVSNAPVDQSLNNPESVVFGPDLNNDGYPEVLVSNRGRGRVDAYDGTTLTFLDVFAPGVPQATGLFYTGAPGSLTGTLYVGSAQAGNATNNTSSKIYRFSVTGGVATAAPAANQQGAIFSNGTDGVFGGFEGLAVRNNTLYASALLQNKVAAYNAGTGAYINDAVTAGLGDLNLPTGLVFAPNGELLVCSSGTDDIKRYNVTNSTSLGDLVADDNGAVFGLNAPENLAIGPDGNVYVTSLLLPAQTGLNGRFVLRFGAPGRPNAGAGVPATGVGPVPGAAQNAVFAETRPDAGVASLAFFPATIAPTPTPTPVNPAPTPTLPPLEGNFAAAGLESNPLSAPSLVVANRLDASQLDTAADREPNFSRSNADAQTASQLAFASTRTRAARPLSSAPITNPGGGQDLSTGGGSDINRSGTGPTHDIWTTGSQDFTPPILVPIGAGNASYPVVAPGIQSPFPAPRTFEEGLRPGVPVQIGVVLREPESGLLETGSVSAVFYNADSNTNRFLSETSQVNEKISVRTSREQKPTSIGSVQLRAYDDGPVSQGGRERQAGAVRGDGIYYCEGTFTPPGEGDFYFDIRAVDAAGNELYSLDINTGTNVFGYDNIWGFSNRPFTKSSATSDLFVSDYTQGQTFPYAAEDYRFALQSPVESYFLTNPATIAQNPVGRQPRTTTLNNVDTWRVLCRGPVPENVLQAYLPTPVNVITTPGSNAASDVRRSVAAARSCVIWASPYTGTVYAGPGTLVDGETQRRLTNFLNGGGRLFVTGREVIYSLSNGGQTTNTFLRDELQAGWGGEFFGANRNTFTSAGDVFTGRFTQFPDTRNPSPYAKAELNDIQFPSRGIDVPGQEAGENTFADASDNQVFAPSGGGSRTDIITPTNTNGARVTSAYETNGNRVGQRIERDNRGSNGFQSRVVFFSFGLEGVNRRYTLGRFGGNTDTPYACDIRPIIADNVRKYFKTGAVSGAVINDRTNLPIPNFLVEVFRPNGTRFGYARTDANGNYEVVGLDNSQYTRTPDNLTAFQTYTVRPARDAQGNALNPGFLTAFAGTPTGIIIGAPATTTGINFRVAPAPLSSVSGVASQSNGTFDLRADDSVLPNIRVLLRSVAESSIFPGGGKFAVVTTTDAAGRFSFADVPTNAALEVIFNPDGRFESQGGDVPDRSGIAPFEASSAFGRRRIPDAQRPNTVVNGQTLSTITLPADGNGFVLNDGPSDTIADDPLVSNANGVYVSGGSILVPVGRTISGRVLLNDTPLQGASVTIRSTTDASFSRGASITTATGDYAFFDVPTGTYTVTAAFNTGSRILTDSVTTSVNTAQPNDPIVPDIILRKQDVSGLVTVNGAAPGVPLPVVLLDVAGSVVQSQQTTAAGAYSFLDVAPGTYTVRATRGSSSVSSAPFVVSAFSPGPPAAGGNVTVPTINITALGLSGVVTVNGVGTPGLAVQVLDASGRVVGSATSGAGGAFAFADLLSGDYTLTSSVPGRNGSDVASVPVGLSAGQANVNVPLFLYSVRGTVLFRGVGAAGQRVEVLQNGRVIATVTTGAGGAYTVDRLVATPAGTAFQVRASRLVVNVVIDQTAPVTVGIARNPGQALVVDVPPLNLLSQSLQGRVFLNGRPVVNALVQLYQGPRLYLAVRSGAGGVYRFNELPAGTFTLRGIFQGDSFDRPVSIARNTNPVNIDLRLFLQSIQGRVLLNNSVLPNQIVELYQSNRLVQRARTNARGVYLFTNLIVKPGVRVAYVVRATRNGSTSQQAVPSVIRNGGTYPVRDLVLRSQGVNVTVTLNGARTAGATVDLLQGSRIVRRATTPATGLVSFTDVPAGTYIVSATLRGDTARASVRVGANGVSVNVALNLLLQTITGTVVSGSAPIANQDISLILSNRVVATVKSNARGVFTFPSLTPGTYTVRATRNGAVATQVVTIQRGRNATVTLRLALQSVRGTATLDGVARAGILITLLRNGELVVPAVGTAANGSYSFGGVAAGSYVLTASITVAGRTASFQRSVVVNAGSDTVLPNIALTTPPPDSASETYQPGSTFLVSVPFTESVAPFSTTTVARAFSVPPMSGATENFKLFRYNPISREYEQLGATSPIRRGEGYFLQPTGRGVSIKTPTTDATRRPTTVTEFEVTLRIDPSSPLGPENNGFNLIGFPFNPAQFTALTWRNASVIAPDGRRFVRLQDAINAGLIDGELYTFNIETDRYSIIRNDLRSYEGAYVRTFVNGVRVILRPDRD